MTQNERLREAMERAGENPDEGYPSVAISMALVLANNPAQAEITAHNLPTIEIAGVYATARKAGRDFAGVVELCERVMRAVSVPGSTEGLP